MDLLAVHRASLERWRTSMNLVGPGPIEEHYRDAEEALRPLAAPSGRWVDLGTGAGFPGIVFAAQNPGVALDLVDSRRKRCVFLEHVLAEAKAGPLVVVRCQRAEDLEAGAYDGVMARAFAPPPEVLQHAARLLRPGGTALLLVGGDAEVPRCDAFELLFDRAYTLGERSHRSLGFRRV